MRRCPSQIGKGAFAAVAAWYGKQGGVDFRANVSMLGASGDGDAGIPIAAGWYNKYIEQFFFRGCNGAAGKGAGACGNRRAARLDAGKPGGGTGVLPGKLLTQWLDPAYDSLWMGK